MYCGRIPPRCPIQAIWNIEQISPLKVIFGSSLTTICLLRYSNESCDSSISFSHAEIFLYNSTQSKSSLVFTGKSLWRVSRPLGNKVNLIASICSLVLLCLTAFRSDYSPARNALVLMFDWIFF